MCGYEYEWDPWKRFEKERERRMWDPFYRYEYERERYLTDPLYRMEKEMEKMQTDPLYRFEKEQERRMLDPEYRHQEEQRRLMEDPWFRQIHRMEHGLRLDQYADPVYVQEKEMGLGTRPMDYFNPDYRVSMDSERRRQEEIERRIEETGEFFRKFFDPNWMTSEEIDRQLRELEEKRKRDEESRKVLERSRKSGGLFGLIKRIFGFGW